MRKAGTLPGAQMFATLLDPVLVSPFVFFRAQLLDLRPPVAEVDNSGSYSLSAIGDPITWYDGDLDLVGICWDGGSAHDQVTQLL